MISDNGSSDGTLAIARSYADRLPGLVIVDSSAQTGAGYARNVGALSTSAELLAFCDADDEVAPGWLAAVVTALARAGLVAGRFEAAKLNGAGALRSRNLQQSEGLQESPFGPDLPHAGAGNLGVTRDVFFSVDGFDPALVTLEDTDLCWRIQLTGVPLAFCPDALVHVRLRSTLRSMWAQGQSYGRASALLTDRYPSARMPGTSRIATLFALIRDQRSLGSLLWTLGWHVGHRRWRPSPRPIEPISSAGSPAADAV